MNYIECFNPDACLPGTEEAPLGICAEGYDGILCANCIGRFRRTSAFTCEECGDPGLNIFISCILFLLVIFVVGVLVKISMRGSSMHQPLHPVYMKIFLNHFQILQIISKIKFGWPESIQEVLRFQAYISSIPTKVISFDCLLIDNFTGADPEHRFNYIRLYFFYSLPLIVVILSFIFWFIRGCCMNPKVLLDKTVATIAIIWFLFYPTIVTYLAASINCLEIEGVSRLYDDL